MSHSYRRANQIGMILAYYEPLDETHPTSLASGAMSATRIENQKEPNSMRKLLQTFLVLLALSAISGCVYQPPMSQGNVLEQADIDQVEVGMTQSQVRFLLGTPMIDDPFHKNRWDYVYFLKIGRKNAGFKRWVSIDFVDGRVSEIIENQELSPKL